MSRTEDLRPGGDHGHDVTLEGCDLGGGGPHMNQGQVVAINSNRAGGVYNVVVRNNRIHHSCWGRVCPERRCADGVQLQCHNREQRVSRTTTAPTFRQGHRGTNRAGATHVGTISSGRPTSPPTETPAVGGMNQDKDIDRILIHNNIFYRKAWGVICDGPPPARLPTGMFIYNNTFVECGGDVSDWQNPMIRAYNNLFITPGRPSGSTTSRPTLGATWTRTITCSFRTTGDTQW